MATQAMEQNLSPSAILRAGISSVNEATEATHTLSLNLTLKLRAEFLALMSVDYAWAYLKRTQLPCV